MNTGGEPEENRLQSKLQESFTAQIVYKVRAILSPRDSLRYLPRAENKDRKRDSSVGKERAPGSVKGASPGSVNWKQRNAIEAFYFLTRFFYAPLSQCNLRLPEISLLSLSPFTLNFTFRALFSPESPYRARMTREFATGPNVAKWSAVATRVSNMYTGSPLGGIVFSLTFRCPLDRQPRRRREEIEKRHIRQLAVILNARRRSPPAPRSAPSHTH